MMNFPKYLSLGLTGLTMAALVATAPAALARDGHADDAGEKSSSAAMADINPSGHVVVRGATVSSLSGNTIAATSAWGAASISWTVTTDSSTQFTDKKGAGKRGGVTLPTIKVGDVIDFRGSLNTNSAGLSVSAEVVRDRSIVSPPAPAQRDIFQGTLQSVASTTPPTNLTMKVDDGKTFTVVIPANATILKNTFGVTTLDTFHIGDTVRVYGSIETANPATVDAITVRNVTR